MHQPRGESIWGTINTAIEIALNVYMIVAKDKNGIEHSGLMAKKSTAEKNLSPKAVAMAKEDGDWLCYDENTKDIPTYEILQRRVAACKRLESAALKEMTEIKRGGKRPFSDFFGECIPPNSTRGKDNMIKVRNGLYYTKDSDQFRLAVHKEIADKYMSPVAIEFGQWDGDYLLYDAPTSAIALSELKSPFEEAGALVVSEDSLYATLGREFSEYTMLYNDIMQGEYKIPIVDAPVNLFLAEQLENAKQEVIFKQGQTLEPESVQEAEPDFDEEIGDYFEQ